MDSELKKLRIKKGYTLEQFSKITGVSSTYLNDLEKGYQRNPSIDIIEKIAVGLNENIITIYYIIKNMIMNMAKD